MPCPNSQKVLFLAVCLIGVSCAGPGRANDPAAQPQAAELFAKAVQEGHVRVVVAFTLPPPGYRPEGILGPAEIGSQRKAIAEARQTVLGVLAGSEFEVYRIYDTMPFAALKVDACGLRKLRDSPHVRSMQEDALLEKHPEKKGREQ
jgi:hypothetical protein